MYGFIDMRYAFGPLGQGKRGSAQRGSEDMSILRPRGGGLCSFVLEGLDNIASSSKGWTV